MKQVIVLRKDLNMRKGKMVAQGAHASLAAILTEQGTLKKSKEVKAWLEASFTKICVSVDSEEELFEIHKQAKGLGIVCSLIKDSGRTEFNGVATFTAVAVGPGKPELVDKVTGDLKLL